jgi:hypothetical protein
MDSGTLPSTTGQAQSTNTIYADFVNRICNFDPHYQSLYDFLVNRHGSTENSEGFYVTIIDIGKDCIEQVFTESDLLATIQHLDQPISTSIQTRIIMIHADLFTPTNPDNVEQYINGSERWMQMHPCLFNKIGYTYDVDPAFFHAVLEPTWIGYHSKESALRDSTSSKKSGSLFLDQHVWAHWNKASTDPLLGVPTSR